MVHIFIPYMPDTLHYAGVNVYSLRLVATLGRLRVATPTPAAALDRDKCRFTLYFALPLDFRLYISVFLQITEEYSIAL